MMRLRKLDLCAESFPIRGHFAIARGAKTEAVVVKVSLHEGAAVGQGECVPYTRYGESVEQVLGTIEALRSSLESGLTREILQTSLPAGAARNAVDCALWDLEAKLTGITCYQRAKVTPRAFTTAYTISLGSPDEMAAATVKAQTRALLKIKLGGPGGDIERIRAVRASAPQATLIADANEGWTEQNLALHLGECARAGFALIEQPLPAKNDEFLREIKRVVPLCADESVHDVKSLERLIGLYDAVNIKLDKTGGLSEGLRMFDAAAEKNFRIMIGCMVGTSLGMAPALLLAARGAGADFVDLDGPLLLARDREHGLHYLESMVYAPTPLLWG